MYKCSTSLHAISFFTTSQIIQADISVIFEYWKCAHLFRAKQPLLECCRNAHWSFVQTLSSFKSFLMCLDFYLGQLMQFTSSLLYIVQLSSSGLYYKHFVQLAFNLSNGVTDTFESRAQCYKTFYIRNLRTFVLSQSVCQAELEKFVMDKKPSLLRKCVNYGQKMFYNIGPCTILIY